jgi:hypothetical protein
MNIAWIIDRVSTQHYRWSRHADSIMSKNREEKRRRKKQQARRQGQAATSKQPAPREPVLVPSAQTLWRTLHLDLSVQERLHATTKAVQPSLLKRDAPKIRRIEQAADLAALLDLAPAAGGLAEYAWLKRVTELGAGAAAEIVARVHSDWMRSQRQSGGSIDERFIGALRWCGDAGAGALIDCWDALDDYGRSLASVALGLLDAHTEADRLWIFFERTRSDSTTNWVGPLWGLIDFADARAADALLDLLLGQREFYERYGFLSRGGDRRAVLPLLAATFDGPEWLRADATWALTGIAHRLGREGFREAMNDAEAAASAPAETIDTVVDSIFRFSQDAVERHFETFYNRYPSFLASARATGRAL